MKSINVLALPKPAALALPILLSLNGCSYVIDSATENFSQQLKQAVMDYNDPATVTSALPAYLLLQEATLKGDGDNPERLLATANLYNAYLSLLPDDSISKQRLSEKSLDFALRGICLYDERWCELQQKPFEHLQNLLMQTDENDLAPLYGLGSAWASWIQAHKGDWNAVAQLIKVKAIMQRVLELDENHQQGAAHLYLAVMESLVPENLGGNPAQAKQHFERAQQLAPDNLMTRVLYAKYYARMTFDRELHDSLLKSTLSAQPATPGLTLINTLAQQQAQQLLDSANDYF